MTGGAAQVCYAAYLELALARRDRDPALGRDRLDDVGLLGLALEVLVVLAVAEHAEVAGHAVVGMDRDAGEDLLALVEAEPLEVEVRQPDPVRVVRRVLAIVGVDRDLEGPQVLGDLRRVGHRPFRGYRGRPAPSAPRAARRDRCGS